MNNSINPKARDENLIVQELPEETLVYDLRTNEAHCLNKTAAFVWKYCDGKTPAEDIAKLLESNFGNPVEDEFVQLAINLLNEKSLLSEKTSNHSNLPNRRALIKKIGLASIIALPIVSSLTAPSSALAGGSVCACVSPGDCAAQIGCFSVVNCGPSGICAP